TKDGVVPRNNQNLRLLLESKETVDHEFLTACTHHFHTYSHDYKVVSEIVEGAVPSIQHNVTQYSLSLSFLDFIFKYVDEHVTHRALQAIRGTAWFDATRLMDADSTETFTEVWRALRRRTMTYIDIVKAVEGAPKRMVMRCMGLLRPFLPRPTSMLWFLLLSLGLFASTTINVVALF
ncbi:MAG: DUF5995 family protein, partial [Chloroflexota bacterium]